MTWDIELILGASAALLIYCYCLLLLSHRWLFWQKYIEGPSDLPKPDQPRTPETP